MKWHEKEHRQGYGLLFLKKTPHNDFNIVKIKSLESQKAFAGGFLTKHFSIVPLSVKQLEFFGGI